MTSGDNAPATRADINAAVQRLEGKTATKDEFKHLETKIDEKFATKIDLAREVSKLHGEIRDTKQELLSFYQQQTDRILSRLDFYTARMENYRTDTILHGHVLVEVETKLKDHELRLSKIESDRKES